MNQSKYTIQASLLALTLAFASTVSFARATAPEPASKSAPASKVSPPPAPRLVQAPAAQITKPAPIGKNFTYSQDQLNAARAAQKPIAPPPVNYSQNTTSNTYPVTKKQEPTGLTTNQKVGLGVVGGLVAGAVIANTMGDNNSAQQVPSQAPVPQYQQPQYQQTPQVATPVYTQPQVQQQPGYTQYPLQQHPYQQGKESSSGVWLLLFFIALGGAYWWFFVKNKHSTFKKINQLTSQNNFKNEGMSGLNMMDREHASVHTHSGVSSGNYNQSAHNGNELTEIDMLMSKRENTFAIQRQETGAVGVDLEKISDIKLLSEIWSNVQLAFYSLQTNLGTYNFKNNPVVNNLTEEMISGLFESAHNSVAERVALIKEPSFVFTPKYEDVEQAYVCAVLFTAENTDTKESFEEVWSFIYDTTYGVWKLSGINPVDA